MNMYIDQMGSEFSSQAEAGCSCARLLRSMPAGPHGRTHEEACQTGCFKKKLPGCDSDGCFDLCWGRFCGRLLNNNPTLWDPC